MELNPESVDVNKGRVRIEFTDSEADKVLTIYLGEKEAWQLHKMINAKLNMTVKRHWNENTLDIHF